MTETQLLQQRRSQANLDLVFQLVEASHAVQVRRDRRYAATDSSSTRRIRLADTLPRMPSPCAN